MKRGKEKEQLKRVGEQDKDKYCLACDGWVRKSVMQGPVG